MFCGSTSASVHTPDSVKVHRLHCRCWDCDDCRELRLAELKTLAQAGKPNRFLTLTVSTTDWPDPDDAAQALVKAWRLVRQRYSREHNGARFSYLCVFEETKKGWPHLHILVRGPWIHKAWLSARMKEYINSPIVDISFIRSQKHTARYISKYVSKGPGRFERCKRYFRSQSWVVDDSCLPGERPVHDRTTFFHMRYAESLADAFVRVGWSVTWSSWWNFEAVPYRPGAPPPWLDAYAFQGAAPPLSKHHTANDYRPGELQ